VFYKNPFYGEPLVQPLVIVDITAVLFRMYFGKIRHRTPDGLEVGGVLGVAMVLRKLIEKSRPRYLVAVFDAAQKTFRNEIYTDYKANRGLPPDELVPQFSLSYELVKALGIPAFRMQGFEADDLMASLACQARRNGLSVHMASTDKDLHQLISDEKPFIRQFDIKKEKITDTAAVLESYGIRPDQMVDYQALQGDAVDNVPGVAGIGAKSASQLLQHFGSLEGIYADLDGIAGIGIRGAKRVRACLEKGREQAFMSRELVRLRTDLDLDVADEVFVEEMAWNGPPKEAVDFFEDLYILWVLNRIRQLQ